MVVLCTLLNPARCVTIASLPERIASAADHLSKPRLPAQQRILRYVLHRQPSIRSRDRQGPIRPSWRLQGERAKNREVIGDDDSRTRCGYRSHTIHTEQVVDPHRGKFRSKCHIAEKIVLEIRVCGNPPYSGYRHRAWACIEIAAENYRPFESAHIVREELRLLQLFAKHEPAPP